MRQRRAGKRECWRQGAQQSRISIKVDRTKQSYQQKAASVSPRYRQQRRQDCNSGDYSVHPSYSISMPVANLLCTLMHAHGL